MPVRWSLVLGFLGIVGVPVSYPGEQDPAAKPWTRHVIFQGLNGADGVRFADVDGDGFKDLVTGWEQSGVVSICFHPGKKGLTQPWPSVQFKGIRAVEDAVLVDLDGDGTLDVVSCCEGNERRIHVHWAPKDRAEYRNVSKWQVAAIPATMGKMWMYCEPLQIDGRQGVDLVVGSKGTGAEVAWLESPPQPRDLVAWKLHTISPAGWVMSLRARDMDGDGDQDVLVSDRKQAQRGVRWLENPGTAQPGPLTQPWKNHVVGGEGKEVMFLDTGDLDGDGLEDIVVAVAQKECLFLRRQDKSGTQWQSHSIPHPTGVGTGKAVSIGDLNLDSKLDLVFSCEQAKDRSGVVWLSSVDQPASGRWHRHEISGPTGIKFDLVPLLDLDGDGDLDVITTEEAIGLGIIWYENPTK